MIKKSILFFLLFNMLYGSEIVPVKKLDMLETLKTMSTQSHGKYSGFLLGVVYLNGDREKDIEKNIDLAIKYFKKDENNLAYADYLLGYIYSNNGNLDESVRYFKKASSIKTVDSKEVAPVAFASLGYVYLDRLHDEEKALQSLLESSALKPIARVDFTIALIYYTAKKPIRNTELAEIYLNRAYENADDAFKKHIMRYVQNPLGSNQTSCTDNKGKLCPDKI